MRQIREGLGHSALVVLLLLGQPVSSNELLQAAARDGDTATLKSLLEGQADVNVARADGTTALAWAVYRNDAKAVELLIRSGSDVNAADDYRVTPLAIACAGGNAALVQQLLEAGSDPNQAKVTGETPLMICANVGAVKAVRALLAQGADINAAENEENQTALMWAAAEKHPEVVQVLVESGADVHARSRVIPEPEPYVVEAPDDTNVFGSNYSPTVRFAEVSGGFTALHFAAQQGDVDSARVLLEAGADVDSPHPEHGSPLNIAIASGHEALAMFLLERGADPNIKDAWGIAPLHYSLHEGVLILNNYKPKKNDHRIGWSRENMPGLVQMLLDYGADPNVRIEHAYPYLDHPILGRSMDQPPQIDPVGATPLLVAAASGDVESMRMLVKHGADLNAMTIGGATVIILAAGGGAERGVRDEEQALQAARYALEIGGGTVNDHLTERALDGPAEGKEDGRTALYFAAMLSWAEVLRFLAENGADLNAKDRYGVTPLQVALGDPEGRYNRQLKGGNYDERYRRTPAEGKGIEKIAELLLALGAEPFKGEYRSRAGE